MKSTKTIHGAILVVFGLFFFAPGLFLSGLYFRGFLRWWDAGHWVETPCRIESAELSRHHGSKSTTYQVKATYRYVYQGVVRHGDQVGFSTGGDNIGDFHQRAYRELRPYLQPAPDPGSAESGAPAARMFRCYVNPAVPDDAVLFRELRWELQAFMAIFALTFPAVGAGVMVAGLIGWRDRRREERLRALHPGEPWRWQEAWSGPAIAETGGRWRLALYGYTAWAAAVIGPLLAGAALSGAFQRGAGAWLLLIFPALWSIPAGLSLRQLRRRATAGQARLELKTFPVAPGAALAGEVVLGNAIRLPAGAEAVLTCTRRISRRHGNKTSISTETVWSQREPIGAELIAGDIGGTRIPVRFPVPADAPASGPDPADPAAELDWTIDLTAPGTPLKLAFGIPVFVDPNAPVPTSAPEEAAPTLARLRAASLPEMLERQRLVADFDDRGWPRSIHCPAGRNPAVIAFLLVFNVIWTGVAALLLHQHAPLLFRVVWPVSAAALWLVIVRLLLLRRTLTFDDTGLRVLNQLGPAEWRLDLARDQILGFACDSNVQSNNRSFYRIRAETVFGRKHTVLAGLDHRDTADALIDALERWRRP